MSSKKEVALVDEKMPATMQASFESMADAGLEEADSSAYAIPFLAILQSNSGQVKRSDGKYIDGAQEGMLLDSVQQKAIDPGEEGVLVIPVHYRRAFVEWKPRDTGGGFVAEHPTDSPLIEQTKRSDDGRKDILPNGNELVDTRYHYVLLVDEETNEFTPMVINMTSTQVKKSKRFMSMIHGTKAKRADGSPFTPPMFSSAYRLRTVPERKDEYSWVGWDVKREGWVTDPGLFQAGKSFYEAIKSGETREAVETIEEPVSASVDTIDSDDIPGF